MSEGGALRVAVLDQPGFALDRCVPVKKDVTDGEVKWKGGSRFSSLKGKTVSLKFELDSAKLYAFSGLELLPEK